MADKTMHEMQELLKRAHVNLMRNKLTAPYIGAGMLGETSIIQDNNLVPTAATDGINKLYAYDFIKTMSIEQLRYLVLHEWLHVALKHIPRHLDLFKQDKQLLMAAMDFVTNDVIEQIREADPDYSRQPNKFLARPTSVPPLFDPMFRDWSVRQVYHYLRTGKKPDGTQDPQPQQGDGQTKIRGKSHALKTLDEHDGDALQDATPEQVQEVLKKVSDAIHQGGILAGRMGVDLPRAVTASVEPEIDWREELREFISSNTKGRDEYTYRRFNKRWLANDLYFPDMYSEKVGRIINANDMSGSIDQKQVNEFGAELASICETAEPDEVVTLWWDTEVRGEQVFKPDSFQNIKALLKPRGGGGTHVSCVHHYVQAKRLTADCIIVMTDGYVEHDIKWSNEIPTLWLVTQNESFVPPFGRVVKMQK